MYKFIIRLLPLLSLIMSNFSGLFSQHLKPAIQVSQIVKKLVKQDAITEFTVDFIRDYLKNELHNVYFGLNETLQLLSRAFIDVLPAVVFKDVDKRKYYDVIIAGIQYLRSVESKMLLSSYLLNIASWIFIETKDENMKITEANYLVQTAYTHMKVKKLI